MCVKLKSNRISNRLYQYFNENEGGVQWDFETIQAWLAERDEIVKLSTSFATGDAKNIIKLSKFIVKTMDRIAAPFKEGQKVPAELFDITELICQKLPNEAVVHEMIRFKLITKLLSSNKYSTLL